MFNNHTLGTNLTLESALTLDLPLLSALEEAILVLSGKLQQFASDTTFSDKMQVAFGTEVNTDTLKTQWQAGDLSGFPTLEIISGNGLNWANGAYALANNRIYLSYEFLSQNQGNLEAIVALLLEEYGHSVDVVLNGNNDSDGDEGRIFSALVMGESLSDSELAVLKTEDDHGVISLNGVNIAVEMANLTGDGNNNNISGTAEDDVIDGLGGNDTLSGLGGNDSLIGGAGNDSLIGGAGNDTLDGGTGTNILDGGDGNDVLINSYGSANDGGSAYGGIGTDTLILNYTPLNYYSNGIYNTSNRIITRAYNNTLLYFEGVERFNVTGTNFGDVFTINEGDTFDGNGGTDRVSLNLQNLTQGVNFDLTQSLNLDVAGTVARNFEQIGTIRTGSGDDTLTLGGAAYAFDDGSSQVYAGAGTDTLILNYTPLNYYSNGIYNTSNRIITRAYNNS